MSTLENVIRSAPCIKEFAGESMAAVGDCSAKSMRHPECAASAVEAWLQGEGRERIHTAFDAPAENWNGRGTLADIAIAALLEKP